MKLIKDSDEKGTFWCVDGRPRRYYFREGSTRDRSRARAFAERELRAVLQNAEKSKDTAPETGG
jgi:hypothetical protein